MPFTGRTGGSLLTEVRARVRDPNGGLHTEAFILARLTDAQRLLNGFLGLVVAETTMTLNPHQNVYKLSTAIPGAIRIVGMRGSSGTREVAPVPSIDSFLIYGPYWMRNAGHYVESFTTVGRDLVVIYPAQKASGSQSVWYVSTTTPFANILTESQFSVEQCGLILTLTEALLLLRQRDTAAAARAMERLAQAIAPELAADRLGMAPTGLKDKKVSRVQS